MGRGVEHPPLSRAEFEERIELYVPLLPFWVFMANCRVDFTFILPFTLINSFDLLYTLLNLIHVCKRYFLSAAVSQWHLFIAAAAGPL
jgi:hypothetical protein